MLAKAPVWLCSSGNQHHHGLEDKTHHWKCRVDQDYIGWRFHGSWVWVPFFPVTSYTGGEKRMLRINLARLLSYR